MSNDTTISTEEMIILPSEGSVAPGITFESPVVTQDMELGTVEELITPADCQTTIQSLEQSQQSLEQSQQTLEQSQQVPPHQLIFKLLPNNGRGPIGNYYAEIRWENGFEQWRLVRFSTPMDGSCLFHAISNSFFAPYHTETLHGKHVSRNKMVAALRRELAQKLAVKISDATDAPTHYDILNGGNTSAFAEAVPEFSLSYMQNQLDSHTPIGYGYMEFIGNALNKDIYILEALRHDIYVTDELPLTIKGDRNSIVLYYMNGHYELVGIENKDNSFDTHFSPDHSFIRFLHNRVSQITGQ